MADPQFSLEVVTPALVGLGIIGFVARNAYVGWQEAKKAYPSATANTVLSLDSVWKRSHVERFIGLLERMVEAQEEQAQHQEVLADRRNQAMQDQLDHLISTVAQLNAQPKPPARRPPAKKTVK